MGVVSSLAHCSMLVKSEQTSLRTTFYSLSNRRLRDIHRKLGGAMPEPSTLKVFAHRTNADGTVDSICLFCFTLVGSASKELELAGQEHDHFCWRLEHPERLTPSLVVRQL